MVLASIQYDFFASRTRASVRKEVERSTGQATSVVDYILEWTVTQALELLQDTNAAGQVYLARLDALRERLLQARLREQLMVDLVLGLPLTPPQMEDLRPVVGNGDAGSMRRSLVAVFSLDGYPAETPVGVTEKIWSIRVGAETALGTQFRCLSVVPAPDHVAIVVVSSDAPGESLGVLVGRLAAVARDQIQVQNGLSVSVGMGIPVSDPAQLHASYSSALDAVTLRYKLGRNAVVDAARLGEDGAAEWSYPEN